VHNSKLLIYFLILAVPLSSLLADEHHSKWQVGTIMAVAPHPLNGNDPHARKYDVSVKVNQIMYVVLFVPRDGLDTITHRTGLDLLVSVGQKTMAFNDLLGRKVELPIISNRPFTLTAKQ